MEMNVGNALRARITAIVGNVTLRLTSGADLVGTAALSLDGKVVTLTVGGTIWSIPLDSIVAVGGA